jgi:hypothetical protein
MLIISYLCFFFCLGCCFAHINNPEGANDTKKWWNVISYDFNLSKRVSYGGMSAAALLGQQKLYVSVAVISSRIGSIATVIRSILNGLLIPTHIYLFVSKEPYMLDKGIHPSAVPLELQYLAASTSILSIVYTENIGPHRKLLPMLRRFWKDDCVIVTFDDDKPVPKTALFQLVRV